MVALVSFLVIVTLSLIIERIATVALTLTGLSRDAARFQARSALTGTGYTTTEAEQVLTHPARRQIIMLLMGVRHFEIITGVSTLILTFIGISSTHEGVVRGVVLSAGLVALTVAASSKWLDRHLTRLIKWGLRRWTTLEVLDYATLLGLVSGYAVRELRVGRESWMAHRRLNELDLPEEGVTVLAIQRADGSFVGAPRPSTVINPRDRLILYGQAERLAEISGRRAGANGDRAHRNAMDTHAEALQEQDKQERQEQIGKEQLIDRFEQHSRRRGKAAP
jgi:hypothetical protein